MNLYLLVLLLYSIVLMGLGVMLSRKVKNSSDFLVAGRSLGPVRIFSTFLAANIGAGSTVGAAGLGYRFGLAAWWWVGSAAIGCFILSQFVGPRIWRLAKEHGFATLPDFLQFRYNRAVKTTISILFWAGAFSILAAQLMAISWILNTVADIPKWQGCIIGGLVAVVYCTAGGMLASSFINMVELVVTMSGLLIALPFAVHALGGWQHLHVLVQANAATPQIAANHFNLFGAGAKQTAAWLAILVPSFIISPGLLQKVYGARDERSVRLGVGINSIGQVIFAFVPAVLGLCAFAALPHLANPELALPSTMKLLLPKWLGLWTLASIFSAELSATDAILFMLSSSLSVDLYKTFVNPAVSPKNLLRANRIATLLAGAVGVVMAILLPSIIAAVSIFYGLLAVALFVPVIAGLYSKRVNAAAALTSIVGALAVTIVVMQLTHKQGIGVLSPQAIGILAGAVIAVSMRFLAPAASANQGS